MVDGGPRRTATIELQQCGIRLQQHVASEFCIITKETIYTSRL